MQHRSEETRARILTSAESLFARKGYDATGVADICDSAGVSKGAFYHHFPSKQAVFQALLEDWLQQLDLEITQKLANSSDIPSGLITMAGQTGKIFEGARTRAVIFLEFWMQASRQPEFWQVVVNPYYRYVHFFSEKFKEGIVEGSLSPNLDPEMASRLLIAMTLGILLQAFFDPSGTSWEEVTRQGVQSLIEGFRKKEL